MVSLHHLYQFTPGRLYCTQMSVSLSYIIYTRVNYISKCDTKENIHTNNTNKADIEIWLIKHCHI